MVLNCKQVWREISNYIDDDISAEMRAGLEAHLAHCGHCAAILDGAHNVIVLVADERTFSLPAGFSLRLHEKLQRELESK
jgi:anti-sigma factor RsiW